MEDAKRYESLIKDLKLLGVSSCLECGAVIRRRLTVGEFLGRCYGTDTKRHYVCCVCHYTVVWNLESDDWRLYPVKITPKRMVEALMKAAYDDVVLD